MRALPLLLLPLLAACAHMDEAPAANIPAVCEQQVYADPAVRDFILKGAGSPGYRLTHEDALKFAKLDAAHRCMQQRGLAPAGGGVERPRVDS